MRHQEFGDIDVGLRMIVIEITFGLLFAAGDD